MEKTETIYVQLLDEGIEVFRPVLAVVLSENTYKILGFEDYDPETETWQFLPGTIVRAGFMDSDKGGQFLAALEAVT